MKKIFTLIAAMFIVLNINAEQVIENVTWNAWGETTLVDGNNLTFTTAWSGAGYTAATGTAEGETFVGADWSDYDYLIFEVSNAKGGFNLCVEYLEDCSIKTSGAVGPNGYGAVELNPDVSDQVYQAWIQGTVDGATITVDKLILMDADEYAAYKESKKPSGAKINLWSGEMVFGGSWPGIQIGKELFEDAAAGDQIVVTITSVDQSINPDWQWGSQIFFKDGSWTDLEEPMKVEGITEVGELPVTLSEKNLEIAKAGGLVLQGMNVIVTSIDLMKAGPAEEVLWSGEQEFGPSWPYIALPASGFADANSGSKLAVTLKPQVLDDTWQWGSQIFVKNGNWSDLEEGMRVDNITEEGTFEMEISDKNLEIAKGNGLVLQGMNVVVTKVALRLGENPGPDPSDDPEPYVIEGDKYIAITADGLAEPFASITDAETQEATNAKDGKSKCAVQSDNVLMVAVGGTTPANNPADVFDGKGQQMDVEGNVFAWNAIKWEKKNQGDINYYYINGSGNPFIDIKGEAGWSDDQPDAVRPVYTYYEPDGSLGLPITGLYYKFTVSKDANLKIAIWGNKGNRNTFVVDATEGAQAMPYYVEGYINGQNETVIDPETGEEKSVKKWLNNSEIKALHDAAKVVDGVDTAPWVIGAGNQPFWGNLYWEAKAGHTYWVFQHSSQIGFQGFELVGAIPVDKKPGDANNDGDINVADITTIAAYILDPTKVPASLDNADANGDGDINVADITTVAGMILGTN